MAQEILVSIVVESGRATADLGKVSKATGEYKKKVDGVTKAQQDYFKALQPANLEIQKFKLLTAEATKATKEKAAADLMAEDRIKSLTVGERKLSEAKKKLAFEMSKEAKELARVNAAIRQQQIANKNAAFSNLEYGKTISNLTGKQKQFRAQSGLNNAILLESGRLASDASFGFTAIANNLSQLISLFQSYSRTAGGVTNSLKELGKSLLGTGGLLIGVQLLISFLPKIIKSFNSTADSVKKFNEEVQNATKSIDKQIETFNRLNRNVEKYGDVGNFAGDSIKKLRDRFTELDTALQKLDENDGTLITERFGEEETLKGANAIERLKKAFLELLTVRSEEAELEAKLFAKDKETGEFVIKSGEARRSLETKLSFALEKRIRLEKELRQERADFSEIGVDLSIEEREISFADLFTDPSEDEKLQEMLDDVPEFIDNVEEVAEDYAREKAKESLISKIFKLDKPSRDRDLEQLEHSLKKFGSTSIKETDEYRKAVKAINDKWDDIEKKEKAKHLQVLLNNTADFLNAAAALNEKNKDIARAAIIASSAAASVGIWQSYHDIKAEPKGFLATAGAVTAQAALVLSTVNALKQLESNNVSAGSGSSSFQAPDFNVVGASETNQLAQAVGGNNFIVQPVAFESDLSDALNMGDANTGRDLAGQRSIG